MARSKCFLHLLIILILFKCIWCFHVNFREQYDVQVEPYNTQIFKRELTQFFDKASYSFNGFEKIASVPVLFPLDICIMELNGTKYASTLHVNKNGIRHFAVYKTQNEVYTRIVNIPTPLAITMDCRSIGGERGYIALAYNITKTVDNALDGSPIFELSSDDRLRAVQYFAAPHIRSIFLHSTANDLFMLQTFQNTKALPNLKCPFFKWSGSSFNKLANIPCSNSRRLQPFSIDYENYVAVANYADQSGRTETHSEIYKFDRERRRFQLFQRIRTNGAIDVKYFSVPVDAVKRQHFLIFGNSFSSRATTTQLAKAKREGRNLEADSVFFLFEKGQFVPYQKLSFYDVVQFLPVQSADAEKFLLLVACKNQDIKIFNLNDWKFEESNIQFTEGALGKGVSNMRIYQGTEYSYLVIANELMSDNETNIFLPIFKQDEHANALRQQIIEWSKRNMERLEKIDVEKLKEAVERKFASQPKYKMQSVNEIPKANIQNVVTKSLNYPRLHFSANYWKALSYAQQALDALEAQVQQTNVRDKREADSMQGTEYEFDKVNVGTLIVNNKLQARIINGYDVEKSELKKIIAKKVIVTGNYECNATWGAAVEEEDDDEAARNAENTNDEMSVSEENLTVDQLELTGKLNEYSWNDLINNTLKRKGQQFLKAPVNIERLSVNATTVTTDEINGHQLAKLVAIDSGSYVIDQGIQFATPVKAKNLVIHERLNNIHVFKNQFDVLLKNSNVTQVIAGSKRFESVKVMEPITLAGQVMGQHLRSMAPNKAVHESITLSGDYTITGDVTIAKLLAATDIIVADKKMSTRNILTGGIRMDKPLENVIIKLEKPLVANNSVVKFINTQDLQQLVKTNTHEVQVVEAEKQFDNSLEIQHGFSEVKYLNGIDMEQLENRLLLRDTNQTIMVPMHFGKIISNSITSPKLSLNLHNLTDYLTKSGTQQIQGTLRVDKLTANHLQLQDLHTNGKIFDKQLSEIYQQKAQNAPTPDIFRKNQKFYGSIYVRNLMINTTINGKPVLELEQELAQLDGNVKYVGNLIFNYDMRVSNLTFTGKFNGIPAEKFGKCWLQKYGVQNFTAAQTLGGVQCDGGLLLYGTLNGYHPDEFITKAYWINRHEHIESASFANPIQLQRALISKTVNNLQIPQDMLYRNAAQAQILTTPLSIEQNLKVEGYLSNLTTVNDLNLEYFDKYLAANSTHTLYVENAIFETPPQFSTLNQHDLRKTLDDVWLANENVDLQHHVEIAEGHFEGLLDFEGPINNMNLNYLKENYFSLSRPQDISAEIMFGDEVKFDNALYADDMHLFGSVLESTSQTPFNFNEFVSNTLKTSGPHDIGGHWTLEQTSLQGDLQNVLINQLNLAQDVVRLDVVPNKITAPKHISSASIQQLYATPTSKVNGVPVSNWIKETVYAYENYTIPGTTTLETVNIYNDLRVDGTVNQMIFNERTLLLRDRDQVLRGPVRIHNKFAAEQRILANNFESLQTETVNGWNVAQFYANKAKVSPSIDVHGDLVFNQPLRVEQFVASEANMFSDVKWKRGIVGSTNSTAVNWHVLARTVKALRKSYSASNYVLDDFEVRQILQLTANKLFSFTIRGIHEIFDIIGVYHDLKDDAVQFYTWDKVEKQYVLQKNLSWVLSEISSHDIISLPLKNIDFLIAQNEKPDLFPQNIISKYVAALRNLQVLKNNTDLIEALYVKEQSCVVIYGGYSTNVAIYCLQELEEYNLEFIQKATIKRTHVKQVLALSTELIALLYTDAVEIWNISATEKAVQRLTILNPIQMAIGWRDSATYLAIISETKANSLHHGAVEIYRSMNNASFVHMQTIRCTGPLQLEFNKIEQSDDLLLHIRTNSSELPLLIYQYKGVMGFQQIVAASTLPTAYNMQIIKLRSTQQHMIALLEAQQITFVEIMLKKY